MYRLNSKDFLNFRVGKEIKLNDFLPEKNLS